MLFIITNYTAVLCVTALTVKMSIFGRILCNEFDLVLNKEITLCVRQFLVTV
jgi:hypothetical protein